MSAEIIQAQTPPVPAPAPETEEQAVAHHDSEEYESAEEVEEASFEEGVEGEVEEVEVEVEEEEEVEDEEEEVNEESSKEKEVDEDRKNPQFIPKKGYFYEHDDRTGAEEGVVEEEPATIEKPKPKPTPRDPDRWTHDLFDEEEQSPKTRTELSGRYGYDIRSEDQAPRARRRRRYGRGPTKYTRKWEEEEAYQKPRGGQRGRGGRGSSGAPRQNTRAEFEEDFPELGPAQPRKPAVKESESPGARKENYYQAEPRGDSDRDNGRGGGGGGGRGRGSDRERYDDGRGRGGGGGRGWGRRNEFSNRNRYPDRRGSGETGDSKDYAAAAGGTRKDEKVEKPKENYYQKESVKIEDTKKVVSPARPDQAFASTTNANAAKKSTGNRNPPPFTNTEYKGSESLATVKPQQQQNLNERAFARPEHAEPNYNTGPGRDSYQDEHDRRTENRGYPQDRRAQVPPRLQQGQQQPQQTMEQPAPKPKRFSTQRQRQGQVMDPTKPPLNTRPGQGTPPLGVVSGPGPAVSAPVSGISGYPQSQGYYDTAVPSTFEARAFPGSGPSVSVSGSGHGPNVTPSLWVPNSSPYVNAPYPSPPTGPQGPQQPYQDPPYMQPPQGGPPIFAPPPHPQFIQDPTIINYVPPVPPPNYGPPSFHASGFQGYAQVAPPPPPELYHAGVTYYSPQNQISRPHMPAMSKRPKTVLQLVEPPNKKDMGRHYPGGVGQNPYEVDYREYHEGPAPTGGSMPPSTSHIPTTTGAPVTTSADSGLVEQLDTMKLNPEPEKTKKSPSPAPLDLGEKSWSEQMADDTPISSPTDPHGPEPPLFVDKSNDSKEETKGGNTESSNEQAKAGSEEPK